MSRRNQQPARRNQQQPQQQPEPPAPMAEFWDNLEANQALFADLLEVDKAGIGRFLASIFQLVRGNPKLLKAHRGTLIMAVAEVAAMRLDPNPLMGEVYLIPRKSKTLNCVAVNAQLGYPGQIKLINRGCAIDTLTCEVIRRGDHVEHHMGTDPKLIHRRPFDREIDESDEGILAAYTSVHLRGSSRPYLALVRRHKLDEVRKFAGNGVWDSHFEEMCKKTSIHRVAKIVPGADEARRAALAEDTWASGGVAFIDERVRKAFGDQLRLPGDDQRVSVQAPRGLDALLPPEVEIEAEAGVDGA